MTEEIVSLIQPHDRYLIIAVQKRTLDDSAVRQLVDEIYTAAPNHPTLPIVLDMSKVKFAPSIALGSLVQMTKSFALDGRRLVLIGVDARLRSAVRVTRLDSILEIYNQLYDLEQAINRPHPLK
ncbi:MAG: hypothetical protein HJJLKODD_00323 [Phycisphaerae bacterium]|nr:hypothetical protein [Phycisphaerae bacterium]